MGINLDVVRKVLGKALFDPMGVEFVVSSIRYNSSEYSRDETIQIIIYVDLERFMPIGNSYDREYENSLYSIEDSLEYGFALLGMDSNDFIPYFEYINRGSIDKILNRMDKKLFLKLSDEFGVSYDELDKSETGFYFYGADSQNPYIRIEANLYDLPDPIDESRAEDISREIFYEEKPLSNEYDIDIVY